MQLANPITVGDQTFDRLTINLAVSTQASAAGDDMSVVIRAVPTGIAADGSAVTLDAHAASMLRGRLSEMRGEEESGAAASLMSAIQQFIAAQGW